MTHFMTIEACDVCNKIIEYTNDYLLSCSKLYANAVKYSEKIINYTKTLFLNCVKCVIPILYRINIEKYDNSNTMHILFQCDYDKNELPTLFVIKFNRYHELGFNVLPALLITSNKAASIIQYVIDNITEEETFYSARENYNDTPEGGVMFRFTAPDAERSYQIYFQSDIPFTLKFNESEEAFWNWGTLIDKTNHVFPGTKRYNVIAVVPLSNEGIDSRFSIYYKESKKLLRPLSYI